MDVRRATYEDLDGITALLGRCYPILMRNAYADDVLAVALPLMTVANPELIVDGRFYVSEIDGELTGCGGWSLDTPGTGLMIEGVAHIRHFAVDPQHTRKGVGQAIFKQCERDARKAGMKTLQAYSSLNAEPFYQSMGLKRKQQMNVLMGGKVEFPVIFMEGPIGP